VGFQEIEVIDIDLSGLGLPIVIQLDFLPILQAQLAARGLNYVVAASVQNITAAPIPGVSLIDFDVMMVDDDRVTVTDASGQSFDNNIGEVAPGVELIRGWVSVDATIGGESYTIVNTHLESGDFPGFSLLRAAQTGEILTALGFTSPALILGDLNDDPGTPMYQLLAGAGFDDVWAALRPGALGYSCCHLNDLSNKLATTFDERIDYVWTRGVGHPNAGVQGQVALTGLSPSERIDGPAYTIWPSDHAGLVATLLLPPAHGVR
jgi:hypothetical protein